MPRPKKPQRSPPALTPTEYAPLTAGDLTDEQVATLIDAASNPYKDFVKAAEELGVSREAVIRMVRRVEAGRGPVVGKLRKLKTRDLLDTIEDRIARAFEYLDDEALAATSAKDLAIILGILLEKRQLLRGEPTQILGPAERASLDTLIPQLVKEAEKRGLVVMNEHAMVDVTPGEPRLIHSGAPTMRDIHKVVEKRELEATGEPITYGDDDAEQN